MGHGIDEAFQFCIAFLQFPGTQLQFFRHHFAFRNHLGIQNDAADFAVAVMPGAAFPARPVDAAVLARKPVFRSAQDLAGQSPPMDLAPLFRDIGKHLVVPAADNLPFADPVIGQKSIADK